LGREERMTQRIQRRKIGAWIDDQLWRDFLSFCIRKHGSTRHASKELENAIRKYIEKNKKN